MVHAMCPVPSLDVRRFTEIDSTNTYLLGEARRGAPAGTVALAEHQRAGRGRLGRRWEAPPGSSLLCSILLRPVLEPDAWHLATACVALAAADACADLAVVTPGLKWPNDLVVHDRKLAGLLAEAEPSARGGPPGSSALVIGLGLNVTWPGPPDAAGTSLSEEAGRPVAVEQVAKAVLDRVLPWAEGLESAAGRQVIATAMRERSDTLGRQVRVVLADEELLGTAVDLSAEGHLVVETAAGRRSVAAGDVVLLRPR
jgi:BirA family biotin operon repressor/biotin-[acetyl-CoA-carboxylase] ligase